MKVTSSALHQDQCALKGKGGNKDKRGRGKKKKEGPRYPLSAYNLFFKHEREVLLETLPVRAEGKPRRSHGKIGFADMARVIGNRWRNIHPEEKELFDKLALQEKERYQKELKAFKEAKKVGTPVKTAPLVCLSAGQKEISPQQQHQEYPPRTYEQDPTSWSQSKYTNWQQNTWEQKTWHRSTPGIPTTLPGVTYYNAMPTLAGGSGIHTSPPDNFLQPIDPFDERDDDLEPLDYRPDAPSGSTPYLAQELCMPATDCFVQIFH